MKIFKQSIMVLSSLVFSTQANAYGLVIVGEAPAPVTSIPAPSILAIVVFGVIAVGLISRKSHQ